MATDYEDEIKRVKEKIEAIEAKIKKYEERSPDDPKLPGLELQLAELRKKENLLMQAQVAATGGASAGLSAGKRVKIHFPIVDEDDLKIKGYKPQEVVFNDEEKFERYMARKELQGLKDADGRSVSFFGELVDGGEYTALLRPSSGIIQTLHGSNRSRINAAEQEFGHALRRLVAEEEKVNLDDVLLVPEARQVRDVEAPSGRESVLELDAVLFVNKTDQAVVWIGSHKAKADDFKPVKELLQDRDKFQHCVAMPERYPALKPLKGCTHVKPAFYAEYISDRRVQNIKDKCIKSKVMLIRRDGSNLVRACTVPTASSTKLVYHQSLRNFKPAAGAKAVLSVAARRFV